MVYIYMYMVDIYRQPSFCRVILFFYYNNYNGRSPPTRNVKPTPKSIKNGRRKIVNDFKHSLCIRNFRHSSITFLFFIFPFHIVDCRAFHAVGHDHDVITHPAHFLPYSQLIWCDIFIYTYIYFRIVITRRTTSHELCRYVPRTQKGTGVRGRSVV